MLNIITRDRETNTNLNQQIKKNTSHICEKHFSDEQFYICEFYVYLIFLILAFRVTHFGLVSSGVTCGVTRVVATIFKE